MLKSNLSTWPTTLFGVLEPAALVWAYVVAIQSPEEYYVKQVPNASISRFDPHALTTTLQLANVLLLLATMALICIWTPHKEISWWYLFSVAIADLGHIYAIYVGVGAEYFWNFRQWNDMVWGGVGVSAFLHINRLLTLAGVFDSKDKSSSEKKRL